MPPMPKEVPDSLKPYVFHGIELRFQPKDKDAIGDCPWCGREGKFNVLIATGVARCPACNDGGNDKGGVNHLSFIKSLWERSYDLTTTAQYKELALDRKYLYDDTLLQWHLARSFLSNNWLIPGYGIDGSLKTLYQYVFNGKRMVLLPTPTMKHHLHGVDLFDPDKLIVYLCEGIWDAIALWEVLSVTKVSGEDWVETASREASLLADANVLAIPGNMTFFESWCSLFAGKWVVLMCQNDHPHLNPKTKKEAPPASYNGMMRIANMLANSSKPPQDIQYLNWGEGGFDRKLKTGYDIRDAICG